MTNLPNRPKQSNFETTLAQPLDSSSTTVVLTADPDYASGGETTTFTILNPKGVEHITATGWSSNTLSGVTRGVVGYTGGSSTARAHPAGTKVILGLTWQGLDDINTALDSKVDVAGDTMTGALLFSGTSHAGIRLLSLTTAQRTALSPTNGDLVYDSDLGQPYVYAGGTWTAVDLGTTFSNASETVAGKVEIATTAEFDAGTDTGGTGAKLAVIPSMIGATTTELSQLSGTTNIAEADTFFGATDITGAQAETLSDGSAAESLHYHTQVVVQGSRSLTTATGSATYAHGLSTTPKYVHVHATCYASGSTSEITNSVGFSDGTNHKCHGSASAVSASAGYQSYQNASACVDIKTELNTSNYRSQSATASFDGTNVTLSWTLAESGSPTQTGTIYLTMIVFA